MAAEEEITITGVRGRMIYDSRGNPTVECDILTQQGQFRAAVPSGASTGIYEALEMRDGEKENWLGKGVNRAVNNINKVIQPQLLGKSPLNQTEIDTDMVEKMDGGTGDFGFNKSKLGGNAILAVSLALARAGAAARGLPLYKYIGELAGNTHMKHPVPAFNVINGGSHAGNQMAFQEFMLLPTGASDFTEAMKMGAEIYQHLKKIVVKAYGQAAGNVGDEGGFAPDGITSPNEVVDVLVQAITAAGYIGKIELGMDCAASEFMVKDGENYTYNLNKWVPEDDGSNCISSADLVETYVQLGEYCASQGLPLISVEDGFDQDDWEGWKAYTARVGETVQVVGDDLTVTNPIRIKRAIDEKACNALLLKVNQIGSLTEAIQAVKMSKQAGWGVMCSHRSGETSDPFIADLAIGLCTGQIKTGAPCRSERLAKYNQLLRIEEDLKADEEFEYCGNCWRGSDLPKY